MYVILVYDISLEDRGAKVLRNVFKISKKYLNHIQASVFEGELSKVQVQALKKELNVWIRPKYDSVVIFQSRNERWLDKDLLGRQDVIADNFL